MLTHLAARHADYAVSLEALRELLAAELSAGNRQEVAWAHIELGNVHFLNAAYTDAWAFLERGMAEASDLDDVQLETRCRHYRSMLALCEGRYELARTLATEASRPVEPPTVRSVSATCVSWFSAGWVAREDQPRQVWLIWCHNRRNLQLEFDPVAQFAL